MFDLNSKVLIVDDMKTMRKLVQKACREIGFSNFVEAEDGQKAWQVLIEHNPDLVISDWNMPNCSGIELLKRVRAHNDLKHVPFVLLTAESKVEQVKEALQAGVTNFIVKPFSTAVLRQKLEESHKKISAGCVSVA